MPTSDQNVPQTGELPDTPEEEWMLPRPRKNVQRLGPGSKLEFPPVANGVDYLVSVVDHLKQDTGGTPRDVKYAVLHLQAAAEVLLKARLHSVHWSLVFKDPGRATYDKYVDGSFASCTTEAAVERLRNIARLDVSKKDADALRVLADDRNRLQHYGLTHNALAVEARAAIVLDFLVRFLDKTLLPAITAAEASAVFQDKLYVRSRLSAIQSFVTERMNRLRGNELKGAEDRTICCPECQQLALITQAPGGRCHFCDMDWDAYGLAHVLQSQHQGRALSECLDCHTSTLADEAEFADGTVRLYCTTCARRYAQADLATCAGCGCLWPVEAAPPGTGQLLCRPCQERIRIRREVEERLLS